MSLFTRFFYPLYFFLIFSLSPFRAFSMHIAEGYLPPMWCLFWALLSLPFILLGVRSIKSKMSVSDKSLPIIALSTAFAFVLSSLKIPSVTGSSSHPTGVGLGAVIFGPFVMSVISTIVLLFQALLLAHGGITTLGANVFSMGIVGPICAYYSYRFIMRISGKVSIAVFIAAFMGDIMTYVTTSIELALAFPDSGSIMASFVKFSSVFAITQLPLAVVEGILTVVIFNVLEKYYNSSLKKLAVI